MNYLFSSLSNLTLSSPVTQDSNELISVSVKFNDKEYKFNGKTSEESYKLYYNLLNQCDKLKNYNDYPTTVEVIGDSKKTYKFTTYKKLF